jgi:hypothetical protein
VPSPRSVPSSSSSVLREGYAGAAGAVGLACTGVLVSLAFQGEGSRSCSRGEGGVPSSFVCQEGLTTKIRPSNGAWSHVATSGAGDQEY